MQQKLKALEEREKAVKLKEQSSDSTSKDKLEELKAHLAAANENLKIRSNTTSSKEKEFKKRITELEKQNADYHISRYREW